MLVVFDVLCSKCKAANVIAHNDQTNDPINHPSIGFTVTYICKNCRSIITVVFRLLIEEA